MSAERDELRARVERLQVDWLSWRGERLTTRPMWLRAIRAATDAEIRAWRDDLARAAPPDPTAMRRELDDVDELDENADEDASAPTPWTREDVAFVARALRWPRVELGDGRVVEGEDAWRATLDEADVEELQELHAALDATDAEDEDTDRPDDVDAAPHTS